MSPAAAMPASGLAYVLAAYLLTFVVIGGYILSLALRRRAQERERKALAEPSGFADPTDAVDDDASWGGGENG